MLSSAILSSCHFPWITFSGSKDQPSVSPPTEGPGQGRMSVSSQVADLVWQLKFPHTT